MNIAGVLSGCGIAARFRLLNSGQTMIGSSNNVVYSFVASSCSLVSNVRLITYGSYCETV